MQPFYLWIIRSNKKQAAPCEHEAAVIYKKEFYYYLTFLRYLGTNTASFFRQ